MAHTKQGGTVKTGRDSQSKRLGIKLFAGQAASAGNVLIRQRGTKFYAGKNVRQAADDTLYALVDGTIQFRKKPKKNFHSKRRIITLIDVIPASPSHSKTPNKA